MLEVVLLLASAVMLALAGVMFMRARALNSRRSAMIRNPLRGDVSRPDGLLVESPQAVEARDDSVVEGLRRQMEALRRRLAVDIESGLGNFRQLEDDFARLAALHQRHGTVFSAMIVKVEHSTRPQEPLNRATIAAIAKVLFETARTEDVMYRVQPQTFVGLLHHCDAEGARRVARRALRTFDLGMGDPGGERTYVAAFCGAAEWGPGMGSLEGLLEVAQSEADEARRIHGEERDHFNRASYVS